MTTIELTGGVLGGETLLVRCNLADASAPVMADYGLGNGWEPTQYQTADCRHSQEGLAEIGQRLAEIACECRGEACEWAVV